MRTRVKQAYRVKATGVLPHPDETIALVASGMFALRYPDDPISEGLQKIVAEIG